jgi:hypothetical protein
MMQFVQIEEIVGRAWHSLSEHPRSKRGRPHGLRAQYGAVQATRTMQFVQIVQIIRLACHFLSERPSRKPVIFVLTPDAGMVARHESTDSWVHSS